MAKKTKEEINKEEKQKSIINSITGLIIIVLINAYLMVGCYFASFMSGMSLLASLMWSGAFISTTTMFIYSLLTTSLRERNKKTFK